MFPLFLLFLLEMRVRTREELCCEKKKREGLEKEGPPASAVL